MIAARGLLGRAAPGLAVAAGGSVTAVAGVDVPRLQTAAARRNLTRQPSYIAAG
jgi:hypothetical protein